MAYLTRDQKEDIITAIASGFNGRIDGGRKNIVCDCPFCRKRDKFGIFIGKETERKKVFMSNCFSCGNGFKSLKDLLEHIGREDLVPSDTADLSEEIKVDGMFSLDEAEELKDDLVKVDMPEGYKQVFFDRYLNNRGFEEDDYDYFPAGTTDNFKLKEYIIIPIIEDGTPVGYVARHKMSKKDIDHYNRQAAKDGSFKIMRYRNSTENDFINLLYNYDSVIEDETETVVMVEGVFDVITTVRELNLYDSQRVAVVATFGKKVSDVQMFKIQSKGVKNIILMYDSDAVEPIKKIAQDLNQYFNCYIADPVDSTKDAGDMEFWEFWDTFNENLYTPREYAIKKVQE